MNRFPREERRERASRCRRFSGGPTRQRPFAAVALQRAGRTAALLTILALLFIGCASTPEELRSSPEVEGRFYEDPSVASPQARIEERLARQVEEQEIPALAVAIHGGRQRIELAFGTEGPSRETLITLDARFRIGSVTKLFTAVVVLSLVEEGRLDLDQTVAGWFPELRNGERITVRHLLQHRSGVHDYTSSLLSPLGNLLRPRRRWEPEQILRQILRGRPEFEPGARYGYSNSNYILLGLIAERVAGSGFDLLLEQYVAGPLGLSDTYLAPTTQPPPEEPGSAGNGTTDMEIGSLLTGYDYDLLPFGNQRIRPDNTAWSSWAFTAGAVVSTPEDMARFLSALFEGQLLSADGVELMTDYVAAGDEEMPSMIGYGLGVRVLEIRGEFFYGHTGTIPGFGALLFYWPERSLTLAMAANRSTIDHAAFLSALVQELAE